MDSGPAEGELNMHTPRDLETGICRRVRRLTSKKLWAGYFHNQTTIGGGRKPKQRDIPLGSDLD